MAEVDSPCLFRDPFRRTTSLWQWGTCDVEILMLFTPLWVFFSKSQQHNSLSKYQTRAQTCDLFFSSICVRLIFFDLKSTGS